MAHDEQAEMFRAHFHRTRFWLPALTAAAFIVVPAALSFDQTPQQGKAPSDPPNANSPKSEDTRFGSPEMEMRSKAILKEAKKNYDENLARAKEVSDLAAQLNEGYEKKRAFSSDDAKRLERLEKLTKRIRNEAGGSGSGSDDAADLKDISAKTEETVKRLAEVAEELHQLVEKTPRNVISAAVIDQANRLLVITQHLRSTR